MTRLQAIHRAANKDGGELREGNATADTAGAHTEGA